MSSNVDSNKFIEKLTVLLPVLSNNNHHAAFFHHMIDNEIHLLMERNKLQEKSEDFVSHPIPLTDDRIRFLPMFTQINSSVYEREVEGYHSWVTGGGNYVKYIETKKDYYSKKESWVVKKILFLSSEFVDELNELGKITGIPLSSIYNIYSLIIATDDSDFGNKSTDRNFNPKEKLIATQDLLSPFLKIPVPVNITQNERDELLCSAWENIYNLLVECYWVLLIVGMTDLLNIIDSFRYDGLQEAKTYLLHSIVYLELEDRVEKIKTVDDLLSFLNEEFCLFNLLRKEFSLLIPTINVKRFNDKLNDTINYYIRSQSIYQDQNEDNSVSDLDKDRYNKYLRERYTEETENNEDVNVTENDQKYNNKKQPKEPPLLSEHTITKMLQNKMKQSGLLTKYKLNYELKYDPENVIHYIGKTIFNIRKTIKKQNFSYEMQQNLDVSSSTFQRWRGKGIISDKPSRDEIEMIQKDMKRIKEHKVEKYYTQNQLIKEIQTSPRFEKYFQSQNKSTHTYSRTALRNKINSLIKDNRIQYEYINDANQFKISDIMNILKELAKISK